MSITILGKSHLHLVMLELAGRGTRAHVLFFVKATAPPVNDDVDDLVVLVGRDPCYL